MQGGVDNDDTSADNDTGGNTADSDTASRAPVPAASADTAPPTLAPPAPPAPPAPAPAAAKGSAQPQRGKTAWIAGAVASVAFGIGGFAVGRTTAPDAGTTRSNAEQAGADAIARTRDGNDDDDNANPDGDDSSETPETTAPPTTVGERWQDEIEPAAPYTGEYVLADDGIHRVGSDLKPGLYISAGSGDGCYWETRDIGSTDITDNHFGAAGGSVTLRAGQEFETSRCGTWVGGDVDNTSDEFVESVWYAFGASSQDSLCAEFDRAYSLEEFNVDVGDIAVADKLVAIVARECN